MLNEDQEAVAEFAAELVKGLTYVDSQTTSRPSQTPPALRANPRDLITNLVKQVRKTPTNDQQLKSAPKIVESINPPDITQVVTPEPTIISTQENKEQMVVGRVNPIEQQMQLELNFNANEKDIIIKNFTQINITLTKILNFLNENCTKPRKKSNTTKN